MKMLTFMGPLYEKFTDLSPLLAEETSVGPREIPIFPDTVEYEIKEFPIEGNNVFLPWGARVINIGDKFVTVLVAVEKKEEK